MPEEKSATNKDIVEWGFKILSLVLTLAILPTFKWAWQSQQTLVLQQAEVVTIKNDIALAKLKLEVATANDKSIALIQKDIESINKSQDQLSDDIDDLSKLITKLPR